MVFIKKYKKLLIFIAVICTTLFFVLDFDISVDELKKTYANQYSKFIDIDGMMVHYRDQGDGVPILLLHGSGGSLHTWDGWTDKLKNKYRVISIDLPAFGLTGPHARRDYSTASYIKFLDDFVTKLGLTNFHIAGNSMGGGFAWKFALEYPEKVQKLLLLDAAGYRFKAKDSNNQVNSNKQKKKSSRFSVFKLARLPIINKIFLYFTPKSIIRNNLTQVYYDDSKVTEALVKQYHDFALREGNRQAFMDRLTMKRGSNKSYSLKDVNSPTLVLWGENDRWISVKYAQKFHELIPNSELVIMKETGHLPMEERPEESVKIAMDFLTKQPDPQIQDELPEEQGQLELSE